MEVSKMVADLKGSTRLVGEAGRVHVDEMVAGLLGLLLPHLPAGESLAGVKVLVLALVSALEDSMQQLEAADLANQLELADDPQYRALRDKVVGELFATLVSVRRIVESAYGVEAPKDAGFSGPIERDADEMVARAQAVIERLKGFIGRATQEEGLQVDPAKLIARVQNAKAPVQGAKQSVDQEKRELETTLAHRDQKWMVHIDRFRRIANALTALLDLAGLPEQARKVKPSGRSPGRTAGEVGEPDAEA